MIRLILLFLFVISNSASAQDISITIHPVSVTECVGKPVNIFINAESKAGNNLQYQWYKDGEKVSGAILQVLNFPTLQHNQSGLYLCRVTSESTSESVNSNSASVYALRPTSITLEPEDIKTNISIGSISLNFDAHINGFTIEEAIQKGENIKIQWYQVEGNIHIPLDDNPTYSGTKTNKLSITFNNINDTTKYFATVEGKCGIITTRISSVIKNFNEVVIKLDDLDACDGNIYSLKAQITNLQNHKLEFRWFKDGKPLYYKQNLKGIYSDEIVFNPISVVDSGNYKIETKIKGTSYIVFSNEIKLSVGRKPELVCFRADTLRFNTDLLDKEQKRDIVSGWTKDVRLVIFYKYTTLPVQFDIYRDNVKIETLNSNESRWHLGDIYYLNFDVDRNDEAQYWVIVHNDCGFVCSDTVSVKTENLCDPYNQKINICETDSNYFQIDYINKNNNIKLDYYWTFFNGIGAGQVVKAPWYYFDTTAIYNINYMLHKNMYKIHKQLILRGWTRDKINAWQHGLLIRNQDSVKGWEAVFCCYDIYMDLMPLKNREPENRTVYNGKKDTLFNISFLNSEPYKMDIFFSIYFMKSLNSEPKEVFTGVPDFGIFYYYIKDIDYSDDGYYFALARHNNKCIISTDTIKVTVIPKGIVAGINENGIVPYFSIQPNPATNFIEINLNNEASLIASGKVQIFNILGIDVSPAGGGVNGVDGGGFRIDISHLPAGVYYIRISCSNGACSIVNKFEKFVKM